MNTYHGLIKLLCGVEFFNTHAAYARKILPRDLVPLYDAIEKAHKKYERDITVDEMVAIHERLNPSITTASREDLYKVFESIKQVDIAELVGDDLIKDLWQVKQAEKVSAFALSLAEGDHDDWETLEELVQAGKEGRLVDTQEYEPVTTNVAELFAQLDKENKWRFNHKPLDEIVGRFGPGHLMILAARTEVGKTAAWVSFTFGPEGFLEQGAKVHGIINEEPANRTMMRGLSAVTGLTEAELAEKIDVAQEIFNKVRKNVVLFDAVGMTLPELEVYVQKNKPDILIVDQADKITVSDSNLKDHLRLKHIYVGLREIAKRNACAVLAITQLSADANHRLYVSIADMEGSKTAKQAEADLIICIGMEDPAFREGNDSGYRMLNVGKNKLSGIKKAVSAMLNFGTSRLSQ